MSQSTVLLDGEQVQTSVPIRSDTGPEHPCPACGGETFDFAGERLCEDCIRYALVRYGDEE